MSIPGTKLQIGLGNIGPDGIAQSRLRAVPK